MFMMLWNKRQHLAALPNPTMMLSRVTEPDTSMLNSALRMVRRGNLVPQLLSALPGSASHSLTLR